MEEHKEKIDTFSLKGFFQLVFLVNMLTFVAIIFGLSASKNFTGDYIISTSFTAMIVLILFIFLEFLVYYFCKGIKRISQKIYLWWRNRNAK